MDQLLKVYTKPGGTVLCVNVGNVSAVKSCIEHYTNCIYLMEETTNTHECAKMYEILDIYTKSSDEPEASVTEPEASVTETEASVTETEASVTETEASVTETEASVIESNKTVKEEKNEIYNFYDDSDDLFSQ
ncbi:uncharacterized protein LOC144352380 [Saccoglossus kowalevskii]